jgi:hypothetical protein
MQFTPSRDPVRPPRYPDRATRFAARAMSWAMARLIEGFASYAVAMSPELMWLKDEHSDQTSAPFSGTRYQLSPPNTARPPDGHGSADGVSDRRGRGGAQSR